MNQLSPKVQSCLSDAGFAPRVGQSGKVSHRFAIVTEERQLFVEPVDDLVVVSLYRPETGEQWEVKYPAIFLEAHGEEALILMFQTMQVFA